MGPNREQKFALEKYWRGALDERSMLDTCRGVEQQSWDLQKKTGVHRIAVGDHVLYDMVLSWCVLGRYCCSSQARPNLCRRRVSSRDSEVL